MRRNERARERERCLQYRTQRVAIGSEVPTFLHLKTNTKRRTGAKGSGVAAIRVKPTRLFLVEFQHMPLNKTPPSSSPACTHTCNADPSEPGAGVSVTLTAPLLGGSWTCMSLRSSVAPSADCSSAREIYDAQQQNTENRKTETCIRRS